MCVWTVRRTHLTVVTLHVVVLVHGHDPDGFLRALVGQTHSETFPKCLIRVKVAGLIPADPGSVFKFKTYWQQQ